MAGGVRDLRKGGEGMTFEEVKRIRENPTMDDVDNKELHKMIDIAIEKQIPKKLLKRSTEYNGEYGFCPCCNTVVADYDSNYVCRKCGQALDWS